MTDTQFAEMKAALDSIGESLGKIANSMTTPKSKLQKVMDFLLSAVGIGGGVMIADQIIRWIRG